MGECGAGAQQVGGQGVTGLVGDVGAAEVEVGDPGLEALVEVAVGDRLSAVGVADAGGEQGQAGAFSGCWGAAVAFFEELECLGAADIEALVDGLGDADALVVVADLGLVVPQHGQTAVAADAVQAQSDDLAAAAPGGDDGLPDVPQATVVEVEFLQAAQVCLVHQRTGDVVAEGVAGTLLEAGAAEGDGGQEADVDAEAFGVAGGDGAVEQLAGLVEDELAAQVGNGGGSVRRPGPCPGTAGRGVRGGAGRRRTARRAHGAAQWGRARLRGRRLGGRRPVRRRRDASGRRGLGYGDTAGI